jgi:hypothetical protein
LNKENGRIRANITNRTYRLSKGLNPNVSMGLYRDLLWSKYKDTKIALQILKRDAYCCKLCKSKHKLNVHHIVPIKIDSSLLCVESNLITLCEAHHKQAHNNGNWKTVNEDFAKALTALLEGE